MNSSTAYQNGYQTGLQAGQIAGLLFMVTFIGVILVAVLFLWGAVYRKAGYSFWMAWLIFIPVANLVWLIVFACSKWPIQTQLEEAQQRTGTAVFP